MHDVRDELTNLERQRESTDRIVDEIERQIGGLSGQLDRSSAELILAEDNLAERRAVLERRLVEIYKRGPLYTFQALLAAESFGDLLSRYKYLYLTSRQDRALVTDVEKLRNRVVEQRDDLLDVRTQLDRTREEREAEFSQVLRAGRCARPAAAALKRSARSTEQRLAACRRTKPGSTACSPRWSAPGATTACARARAAPRRSPGPSPPPTSAISTGRWRARSSTASAATRCRAAASSGGTASGSRRRWARRCRRSNRARCDWWGSSGPTDSPSSWSTATGTTRSTPISRARRSSSADTVNKGQTIGTVGGENSDYGAHLHFEIRGENQVALDPTEWLKKK